MTHELLRVTTIFGCIIALSTSATAEDRVVAVSVDCTQTLDGSPSLWGHVNVSRRAPPPVELCGVIEREFGRPKVTRCWLMLDQVWDYRSDTYRFNYEINKDYYQGDPNKKRYGVVGSTTGLCYYDYIDSVSAHSDVVLLNIRRYEQEVLTGMLSFEKWKEVFKAALQHYKQRCPNLRYIEVLNEPTAKNQSNLGSIAHYYDFYRRAYQAVNELNAELKPELPLLVGGSSGFRTKEALHLIHEYARDSSPHKRLGFLSFHHYWIEHPAEIAEWEEELDRVLENAAMSTELPIFVTEIGYAWKWRDDPAKNLWHAVGMTAYQYQARHAPNLRLFPWVQYHSDPQIAMVQFDTRLRMTPYGAAVKMLRMHRQHEAVSVSSGLEQNGNGLGALTTMDDTGLTIQVWNFQPNEKAAVQVEVVVANIPRSLHTVPLVVRRYVIDSSHSNCLTDANATGGLEKVEEKKINSSADLRLSARLEPMALCLWQIERPAPRQP